MLEGFNMQIKWGICALKRKWRCFMKNFDSIKIFIFVPSHISFD